MAVLSLPLGGAALLFLLSRFPCPLRPPAEDCAPLMGSSPLAFDIVIWLSVVAVALGTVAWLCINRSRGRQSGRRLAQLGAILGILTLLAAPNYCLVGQTPRPARAASDAKTAVTQAIAYASDTGVYLRSLEVLRGSGYANIQGKDPWGNEYVLAPLLTAGSKPKETDDVYVYSRGICGTGADTPREWKWEGKSADTGKYGAAGYSSLYGAFIGRP